MNAVSSPSPQIILSGSKSLTEVEPVTGKVKGCPSSEGVGGKISNANVDKNMFEVKGTMIYENNKNEKNSIFHQLELRKIKITSLAGPE